MPKSTSIKKSKKQLVNNKTTDTSTHKAVPQTVEPVKKNRTIIRKFLPELLIVGLVIGLAVLADNPAPKTSVTAAAKDNQAVLAASDTLPASGQDSNPANSPADTNQPGISTPSGAAPVNKPVSAAQTTQPAATSSSNVPSNNPVIPSPNPAPTPNPVILPPINTPPPAPDPTPTPKPVTLVSAVNNLLHRTLHLFDL